MNNLSWDYFSHITDDLEQFLVENTSCTCLWKESSAKHVTFKTGGPMGVLLLPRTSDDICSVISFSKQKNIACLLFGNGSNSLIRDGGFPGIVMKISDQFSNNSVRGNQLTAGGGATMKQIAEKAAEHALQGLEFIVDIPGTIGGGIFMNAGMYDFTISDFLESITVLDRKTCSKKKYAPSQCDFSYRNSRFQKSSEIILEASFTLDPDDPLEITVRMKKLIAERNAKFPLEFPNAGSIFKRPEGTYAGYLIDQAGLKGKKIGGAMVSPKHANFIVNTDKASADNIEHLISEIQEVIQRKFSVILEPELRIFGIRS